MTIKIRNTSRDRIPSQYLLILLLMICSFSSTARAETIDSWIDHAPVVDRINVGRWTCTVDETAPIKVGLYAGGAVPTGALLGTFPSDRSSESGVTNACDFSGSATSDYRYWIALTHPQLQTFADQPLYAYGVSPIALMTDLHGSRLQKIVGPAKYLKRQIWIGAGLYQTWADPPPNPPAWWGKRADTWKMFTDTLADNSLWQRVLSNTAITRTVISISGNSVQFSCNENRTTNSPQNCDDLGIDNSKSLDQFFRYMKAHHIHTALEIGLLIDTQVTGSALNSNCGSEAYGSEVAQRGVFQKIKDAGGLIDYIAMDEPFYYGTISCGDTPANIAADINRAKQNIVSQYFPNVQIGDEEPTDGTAGDPELLAQWADAYASAVGKPFAFLHADATNNDLVIKNFARILTAMHSRNVPFGVIYDSGSSTSNTDLSWTQSAINYYTETESALDIYVDQPVFTSWMANPTYMLPETAPGTVMNTVFQYILPRTYLTLNSSGTSYTAKLMSGDEAPIAKAQVNFEAVDIANVWPPTDRVFTGIAPATAAYAVVGIRANMEGSTMAAPSGEVDLGMITVDYSDASNSQQVWKSSYATPLKLALTPSTSYWTNLAQITFRGGSSYTLDVPMSATGSAAQAGYVTLVFFDKNNNALSRTFFWFSPSTAVPIPSGVATDGSGNISFSASMPISELRAYYDGDNATLRPAMAILDKSQ